MRDDISQAELNALASGIVVARDLIWLTAIDRATGAPVTAGFWSDFGTYAIQVADGETGQTVTRTFAGVGGLVSISDIPMVTGLEVRNVQISLNQTNDEIDNYIRGYDLRLQPVQIYRGVFDPQKRTFVAPARTRFLGFIDRQPIATPRKDTKGGVTLFAVSHTRELTRKSAELRSDESQQRRVAGDRFFKDADTIHKRTLYWGQKQGKLNVHTSSSGGGAGGGPGNGSPSDFL